MGIFTFANFKRRSGVFICLSVLFFSVMPVYVASSAASTAGTATSTENANDLISSPGYGPDGDDLQGKIESLNKFGKGTSVQQLLGRIIKIVLQVSGSIAVIMFVAGGLMWMTARGNSERAALAVKTLVWASLGVVVILSSYIIVDFLFKGVTG